MRTRNHEVVLSLSVLLAASILAGCAAQGTNGATAAMGRETHEQLNCVLWVQTSPEYEIACRNSFQLAALMLDEALYDLQWTALAEGQASGTLPPAVILDVDETVLDNSPFEARLVLQEREYNKEMWDRWIAEEAARDIPGAKEFIQHAIEEGVKVFFVTNRGHHNESYTVRNLRDRFGPMITGEDVLTKNEQPDWTADKTSRRTFVGSGYRVLLLVGDNFNDFVYLGEESPEGRVIAARKYLDYWGEKWIMLPNPMYGDWEQALYGYDRDMGDAMKLNSKYGHLDTKP
jgi:acid phosphatase